ncbi:MAG: cystathionine beta-lyase [Methyloligellaceae bacterium]
MSEEKNRSSLNQNTKVLHLGRNPSKQHGFVNPAIHRGSTVVFPTVHSLETADQEFIYGRKGTPTVRGLETALAELEGGYKSFLTPSGLAAITASLLAFVEAGDHILIADSVYLPTRRFCSKVLTKLGVETTYYDPLIGSDIKSLIRDNTKLVFVEAPGSQTFEMQDIPAIAKEAHEKGLLVLMDNTWGTPLYYKAFEHGVDVSIHAATKYIVGHADAMLGVITASKETADRIQSMHEDLGLCPGPEDAYLGLRGLRTLSVRLKQHWKSGLEIAEWFQSRPEVSRVLHPALPSDPGYELWKRDFTGAAGLFSLILNPVSKSKVDAFLNALSLFGMGWSWGGYESLVIPFNPAGYRTATKWNSEGPALRFHIGLDEPVDLIADLEQAFSKAEMV